jgi:hypothetical protein
MRQHSVATLAAIFGRLSNGASTLSTGEVQDALIKAGGFGRMSPTRKVVKKGIANALDGATGTRGGRVDANTFSAAVRTLLRDNTVLAWSEFDPGSDGSLSRSDIAALVKATARRSSSFGGMVDADGVAQLIIFLGDDDGDGEISKAEFDSLSADLNR